MIPLDSLYERKNIRIATTYKTLYIFLEIPPQSMPCYVANDLSRLPPQSVSSFDVASPLKHMESLKLHLTIEPTAPGRAVSETAQHRFPDSVCVSHTVTEMLYSNVETYQLESEDDDLTALASLRTCQRISVSSQPMTKTAITQPSRSSYADSVKSGRRKTNTKFVRSTKLT